MCIRDSFLPEYGVDECEQHNGRSFVTRPWRGIRDLRATNRQLRRYHTWTSEDTAWARGRTARGRWAEIPSLPNTQSEATSLYWIGLCRCKRPTWFFIVRFWFFHNNMSENECTTQGARVKKDVHSVSFKSECFCIVHGLCQCHVTTWFWSFVWINATM